MAETIHQSHDYGQFKVFYEYVGLPGEDEDQPCMCLGSKLWGKRQAWVIPLNMAHQYADSKSGAPTPYLIQASVRICEIFGMGTSWYSVKKVAEAIVDCLPELVAMPPKPLDNTQQKIEEAVEKHGLKIEINGEKVVH